MKFSLQAVLGLQSHLAEMFLRGSVAYCVIFLLLRVSVRRDMGSLGMADLLVLLLVADAVGNGMSGTSTSTTDGLIAVSAIVFWSVVIDWVGYHFLCTRRWLGAKRMCLIQDGALQLEAGTASTLHTRNC